MKISAILIALGGILSFGAQGVFAGCYGSGDSWPNVEEARTFISDACHKSGGSVPPFSCHIVKNFVF